MLDISLSFPTPDGSQMIAIEDERTSFGRGSEATHRFDDNGLSRLHSTVYREGDRIWVVDENSTNGTFVNGRRIDSPTKIDHGALIGLGPITLSFIVMRAQASTLPIVPRQAAE